MCPRRCEPARSLTGMSELRPVSNDGTGGDAYDRRFPAAAAAGADVHGEATFVESLGVHSGLDAGCDTGRVGIELARRGLEVAGGLDPPRYDGLPRAGGLVLVERFATWDREPWTGQGSYAVSVHRRPGVPAG